MENLNLAEKIEKFLKVDNGYGAGSGYGHGSGDSSGYGYGYGKGSGLSKINGYSIRMVDEVPTIIINVRNNIAKGFIVGTDLILKPCFIVKNNNLFAHGYTLKEAISALETKLLENMPIEERIDMFLENFEKGKTYKGHIFFDWHNKLTNSCLPGRNDFIERHGLDLENEYKVEDFIALTENAWEGHIIKELKKRWSK